MSQQPNKTPRKRRQPKVAKPKPEAHTDAEFAGKSGASPVMFGFDVTRCVDCGYPLTLRILKGGMPGYPCPCKHPDEWFVLGPNFRLPEHILERRKREKEEAEALQLKRGNKKDKENQAHATH